MVTLLRLAASIDAELAVEVLVDDDDEVEETKDDNDEKVDPELTRSLLPTRLFPDPLVAVGRKIINASR